jgi:branched-subunit amino acid aminotransferase/4-amino-4-deoxychorismate lyase
VTLDELAKASEIFITSTTKNIVPVVAMDGRTVGDGRAGPVTLRLCERLEREIAHSLME